MRIAITGGTGFVGGHLAASLSRKGHDVVLIARGVDQRPWAKEVRDLSNVSLFRAGLDDAGPLQEGFDGCDAVAHSAVSTERSEKRLTRRCISTARGTSYGRPNVPACSVSRSSVS